MKTQKFIVPIYGLRSGVKKEIELDRGLFIRNIKLLEREDELFKKYDLSGDYKAILEVNYKYDSNSPSEPVPGVFLKITNKFDASLVVYADGKAGIAAVIPDPKDNNFPGGQRVFPYKVQYEERLQKNLDNEYIDYYKNFSTAYDMRPIAFDIFRRSQERYANNDKTIDSCTVLESIFVPQGERAKKPFILNGMNILGFDKSEIEAIDSLIEYRNSVIHADRDKQLKLLSGKKYSHKWFEDTFKLIRRILYEFVQNPWS